MIRLLMFVAVIVVSFVAGYFIPTPRDPAPPPAVVSTARPGTPQKTAASASRARTDTRRTARLAAQQTHEKEEQKRLVQLERGYVIMDAAEDRSTIIDTISDLETPAIVPALGRLFAIETDPELKEALIEAVGWGETTDAAKAAVYADALGANQPESVRCAAIEGLIELDPKEALPLLRPLGTDLNEKVRAAALEAMRGFENP